MKKSIDHGRPSDVHGTWVMENFRAEKSLAWMKKRYQHLIITDIWRGPKVRIDNVSGTKSTPECHKQEEYKSYVVCLVA